MSIKADGRTAAHYRRLIARNPSASVGATLAASAIYAALYGTCEAAHHADERWRRLARAVQRRGESLPAAEILTLIEAAEAGMVGLWRRLVGLTQVDAAARYGCTQATWSAFESRDIRTLGVGTLQRIAAIIGCEAGDLIGSDR